MIRVVVADDEGIVRTGVRAILASDPGIEVVAEAADGREAVELVRRHSPDVVLLDIRMPRLDGLGALDELRSRAPGTAAVMLTTFGEDGYITRALELGASGFLLKASDPRELVAGDLLRHEREVELGGEGRGELGRAPLSEAADDHRRMRLLGRFRQRRRVRQPVVPAVVREPLPCRRLPETGDDGELLGESVEALAGVGELDAVRRVLGLEPPGPEPELDPPAAHLVDLGDLDREYAGIAEGRGGHQRAEPDRAGLPRDPGQGRPGIRRPGQTVAAHVQVVVGAEERAEPEPLGALGDGDEVVVRGALLRLGEDA